MQVMWQMRVMWRMRMMYQMRMMKASLFEDESDSDYEDSEEFIPGPWTADHFPTVPSDTEGEGDDGV
jgi:hypothetical protein